MVVLTQGEFDAIAAHDNAVTERLARVREWGLKEIEEGRAIMLADFGTEKED